jgi:mannitol-1-/sugar-/sorbitol-6-phosphatase
VAAVIFDLDGVLVDSRAVVARHWSRFAERHGLRADDVIRRVHGRRTVESIAELAPWLDAEAEAAAFDEAEAADVEGLRAVPGAAEALRRGGAVAVVTSGPRGLATARLRAVGLEPPAAMICAEDVEHGKPHPEPYLRGAAALGAEPAGCVVVEDAPAGIAAGIAAGMRVIAISTTHPPAELDGALRVLDDLVSIERALATL